MSFSLPVHSTPFFLPCSRMSCCLPIPENALPDYPMHVLFGLMNFNVLLPAHLCLHVRNCFVSVPILNISAFPPACLPLLNSVFSTLLGEVFSSSLYWKFETFTPRNETAWPRSQFLNSSICERFMYFHDRSSADQSWEYINRAQIYECGKWETEHYTVVLF